MFKPDSAESISALREAVRSSRYKLKPFRESHREAVEEYVGLYYSDDPRSLPNHVNLLEIAVSIYLSHLAAQPPQVNIETPNQQIRPAGKKLEALANDLLRTDEQVFKSIQRCIKTSLFSLGLCKIGLRDAGSNTIEGYTFQHHEPYVKPILLEDWVHDMHAKHMDDVNFSGHRYKMLFEEAESHPAFKRSMRSLLTPDLEESYNESGDPRLNLISTRYTPPNNYTLHQFVELWDVWLPHEKLLVTLSDKCPFPLRVIEWDGPPQGPFRCLYHNEVDGNTMPLAPQMLWQGLHRIVNNLYRKLARQAERQKTVGIAHGQATEDAETIREADDGEIVAVDFPDAVKELSYGSINQTNFAFMLNAKDQFDFVAGNLNILGGLGASAETLGQDQILQAQASQRMSLLRDNIQRFVQNVLSDYCYYLWNDPLLSYPIALETGGDPIETLLTPVEREHSFYEHVFTIEPFSMQIRTPAQKLALLNQTLQTIVLPALPLMQQQGIEIDMRELMRVYSKYSALPELNRILRFSDEFPQVDPGHLEGPRQAGVTSRTYERVSSSGNQSRDSSDRQLTQHLLSQATPYNANQSA